jgi:uncharacterized FlaG/YvyC family protein
VSVNIVTSDAKRLTTSEKYLRYLADVSRSADASRQESNGQHLASSRSHSHKVQITDQISGATVTFTLDKETQELYIQVIDKETDEVIREIPPAEIRRLAKSLKETFGHLFDLFA